jgi:hypothetical protein
MEVQGGQSPGGLRSITYWAWRLDRLLNRQIGSPYRIVLAIGLAVGISQSWTALVSSFHSATNIGVILVTVLFQAALLVNQLAQSHQRRRARTRRQAIKALKPPVA